MNVLVFGAGAIGSTIGGFLAEAGHNVSFIGRSWHMENIEKKGLFITGIWGDHLIENISVFTDTSQLGANFDVILITVKSYDTDEAGKKVKELLSKDTLVIHLQNGLGNAEKLLNHIPKARLISGRAIFGVEIEPGRVTVTVSADDTVLGTIGNVPFQTIQKIAAIFSKAGVPTKSDEDITKHIWAKALYNCALNPLATILEVPYGFLAENPYTKQIMDDIIDEIYDVGSKRGVRIEPETADEYKELFYTKLVPLTAKHHASMLQDVKRGKPTEIDALCGAISRYGRKEGIRTPVNTLMTNLIKTIEIKTLNIIS